MNEFEVKAINNKIKKFAKITETKRSERNAVAYQYIIKVQYDEVELIVDIIRRKTIKLEADYVIKEIKGTIDFYNSIKQQEINNIHIVYIEGKILKVLRWLKNHKSKKSYNEIKEEIKEICQEKMKDKNNGFKDLYKYFLSDYIEEMLIRENH